jgi:rhodanese-related sulfurtransferase
LVEVLDPESYDDFHLPRAVNVPLGQDFEARMRWAFPDPEAELVVYSRDRNCRRSTSAASALRSAGYTHVLDYVDGKEDWRRAGLPVRL